MNTFHQEILKLPKDICDIGETSTFGIIERKYGIMTVGEHLQLYKDSERNPKNDARRAFDPNTNLELPDTIKKLIVYLGSESADLIQGFVNTDYAKTLESLVIGNSSDKQGEGRNYEKVAEILSDSYFPNLKVFHFGEWELLCNSYAMLGKLGDITDIFKNMPNLEVLKLFGSFTLRNPVDIPKLEELLIQIDDYGRLNSGCISQDTLSNFLNSRLQQLDHACLDLDIDLWDKEVKGETRNTQNYTFTDDFHAGKTWNNLKKLTITGGYAEGEIDRLKESDFVKSNDMIIEVEDDSL